MITVPRPRLAHRSTEVCRLRPTCIVLLQNVLVADTILTESVLRLFVCSVRHRSAASACSQHLPDNFPSESGSDPDDSGNPRC